MEKGDRKSKAPLASPRSTNSKTHKNASLSQKSSSVVNIPAAVKFKKRENGIKNLPTTVRLRLVDLVGCRCFLPRDKLPHPERVFS